ncbi:Uncharacterized protein PBTT_04210 [Plasmodiophora brassicae]|uniref:Uncharacterized protein n=1 Tax=Plasmodiophora brassicae TaxID=37360 RepID=A0A3P3Y9D1_PLABS|nr:unnamed protein product [Plasmodiophora brassicae]
MVVVPVFTSINAAVKRMDMWAKMSRLAAPAHREFYERPGEVRRQARMKKEYSRKMQRIRELFRMDQEQRGAKK